MDFLLTPYNIRLPEFLSTIYQSITENQLELFGSINLFILNSYSKNKMKTGSYVE